MVPLFRKKRIPSPLNKISALDREFYGGRLRKIIGVPGHVYVNREGGKDRITAHYKINFPSYRLNLEELAQEFSKAGFKYFKVKEELKIPSHFKGIGINWDKEREHVVMKKGNVEIALSRDLGPSATVNVYSSDLTGKVHPTIKSINKMMKKLPKELNIKGLKFEPDVSDIL